MSYCPCLPYFYRLSCLLPLSAFPVFLALPYFSFQHFLSVFNSIKYTKQLKKELQTIQVPLLFVYVMIWWELPILPLVSVSLFGFIPN
jgi:hypothetical protein